MVTRSRLRGDQVPIKPVSARWIMSQPSFERVSPTFARDGAFTAITIFGTPTANGITSAGEPSPHPPLIRGWAGWRVLRALGFPFFPGKNEAGFSQPR